MLLVGEHRPTLPGATQGLGSDFSRAVRTVRQARYSVQEASELVSTLERLPNCGVPWAQRQEDTLETGMGGVCRDRKQCRQKKGHEPAGIEEGVDRNQVLDSLTLSSECLVATFPPLLREHLPYSFAEHPPWALHAKSWYLCSKKSAIVKDNEG